MTYQPRLAFSEIVVQNNFQEKELAALISYLKVSSPWYRESLDAGFPKENETFSLANLQHFPFTTKDNLQAENKAFFCLPQSEIAEYCTTSGTMGKPVLVPLSKNDLHRLAYNEAQSFRCAGLNAHDTVQLMLTLDRQFMAGMAYYGGLQEMGTTAVRTGPGLPMLQIEMAKTLRSSAMVAVPSFILKLANELRNSEISLESLHFQKAICIGEPLRTSDFSLNPLGQSLSEIWPGLKLYSTYASSEMQTAFTECEAGRGGHLQPDLLIAEIIDDAGNLLPDGEYGELVITTLGVEAMPLLRYKTGDICALFSEPCRCGRKSQRISPVAGRKGQMIKYKGTTLYPQAIVETLQRLPWVSDYYIGCRKSEGGEDELRLFISGEIAGEEREKELRECCRSFLRVVPEIEFVRAEKIAELQQKVSGRKIARFGSW